jgi:hypothetical protein
MMAEVEQMALKEKFSVTLDHAVALQIRAEAGEGRVSEWLNTAALLRLQRKSIERLIQEHGVILTSELFKEVQAEWPTQD